ncbi:Chitin-binding type R&R consensus [Sergentomyia squamirostris]
MKHCVHVILVLMLVNSIVGQSLPDPPFDDLLPPFEDAPPLTPVGTSEVLEYDSAPEEPVSSPRPFGKVISSNVESSGPSAPRFSGRRITEKPFVAPTPKSADHHEAPVPVVSGQQYEYISRDNFRLSPALPDGTYKFSYNLQNGVKVEEEGEVRKSDNSDNSGSNAKGGYSYTAPDGQVVSVQYIADELGYRAVGSHIPAIPEPIARALKYLQSLKKKTNDTKESIFA